MKLLCLSTFTKQEQVALWNEAFADYIVPAIATEASFKARMESLLLSEEESLVVTMNGEAAGIALTGTRVFQSKTIAWIGGIAIVPKFRKNGLARQLMETLISDYGKQSVAESWLEVIANNHPAIRLYESLGYEKINDLTFLKGELHNYEKAEVTLTSITGEPISEDPNTPWQNLISEQIKAASIWQDNQNIGHIIYHISEKDLILLQLNLQNDDQILNVLQTFFNQFGAIPCIISNQEISRPFIAICMQNGFTEVAQQIQMRKTIHI
ncbi:GNAT family N-acetyltransferase [Listeria booriae]|uniref:GNAT family N-acetyltransferase n=1 Tax=Listeria booriae TaxID=1552123 RepID=A0A841Y175_9LIST|nr:GNAT family N-acetyltransferase [Listeria booriae]MBC1371003.1 GNAT family N-acetyltransferase [Listeria booriae]